MKKSAYLNSPVVMQFVCWLGANLDNNTFAHSYYNRRSRQTWSCNSLYDAYVQYHWHYQALPRLAISKGSSFAANATALASLSQDLQHALMLSSDAASCIAAIDVMTWGGVRPGNVRWLRANQHGLANSIIDVRNALNGNDTSHPALMNANLRFNAGMTKVYSLVCNDLIIYDSRVAAALGWMAVKFCQAHGLTQLPKELRFPWAPAKGNASHPNPKQRDPSLTTLVFPKLKAGPEHAKWNLHASWLLEAVLASPSAKASQFKQTVPPNQQLRAIEAAFFMIGYDLCKSSTSLAPTPINQNQPRPGHLVVGAQPTNYDPSWHDCYTLSRGRAFHYRVTLDGIEIHNNKHFSKDDISATLVILWNHFRHGPFPLANSATGVRGNSAPMGLGAAYFQATGKNPPDTSKLAAVLEELGIITPFEGLRGMHWTLNSGLLECDTSQHPVDICFTLSKTLALLEEV